MKIIDFIKPNIWKILLLIVWAILAFTVGYDACASCCPGLEPGGGCITLCCIYSSPFFFPFDSFIESSPLMILVTAPWWYLLSCITYSILQYFIHRLPLWQR